MRIYFSKGLHRIETSKLNAYSTNKLIIKFLYFLNNHVVLLINNSYMLDYQYVRETGRNERRLMCVWWAETTTGAPAAQWLMDREASGLTPTTDSN